MSYRASTGSITSLAMASFTTPSAHACSVCWVETTTVSTRTGTSPSYSTVTWVFPSGSTHPSSPFLRTSARRSDSRCAISIGSGISVAVSVQA